MRERERVNVIQHNNPPNDRYQLSTINGKSLITTYLLLKILRPSSSKSKYLLFILLVHQIELDLDLRLGIKP